MKELLKSFVFSYKNTLKQCQVRIGVFFSPSCCLIRVFFPLIKQRNWGFKKGRAGERLDAGLYWTDTASEQTWEKSRWQMEGMHLSSRGEDCDWWLVAGKSDGSPSGFAWWSLSLKSLRQEAITSLSTAQNDGLQTTQKAPPHTHTHSSTNSAKHILCLVKGIDEQRGEKRFA